MKKSNSQFWLGDEQSLLQNFNVEKKIHETPTTELRSMSLQAQTDALNSSQAEFGEFDYMVSRAGNLAVVNISGSLTPQNRPYNQYIGVVSYDEIRNSVFAALETDGIEGIVLDMDTPGGAASGVSELGDFLREVSDKYMPIYTYVGTTMASGGYWLGSVGKEIYASKLATVGSIGVVTVHADYSKMYKQDGIEITVLRSGEFKALGSPYEKLDDKARSQIQSQMDTIYDVFLETVAENRGTSVKALKETSAEGRVFIGSESVEVGLVDYISSFDMAIEAISKKVKSSGSRSPLQPQSETLTGDTDMRKKKVLTEAGVAALESGVSEADLLNDPIMVTLVEETEEAPAEEAAATTEEGAAEEAAAPATPVASADIVSNLLDRNAALTDQLATLKAELGTAKTALSSAQSTENALCKIAIQAINRMQVSLGGVPMKIGDTDTSIVLDMYNRTHSTFNQRFKVGASAEVPQNDDLSGGRPAAEENSSMAAAATRLTVAKLSVTGVN
jgi:signal peptide peptidase SppA